MYAINNKAEPFKTHLYEQLFLSFHNNVVVHDFIILFISSHLFCSLLSASLLSILFVGRRSETECARETDTEREQWTVTQTHKVIRLSVVIIEMTTLWSLISEHLDK